MQWNAAAEAGGWGGLALIAGLFAANCISIISRHARTPAILRLMGAHAVVAPIFVLVGAVVAYYTDGPPADFFLGVGWLAFLTLLAGGVIPGIDEVKHGEMAPRDPSATSHPS